MAATSKRSKPVVSEIRFFIFPFKQFYDFDPTFESDVSKGLYTIKDGIIPFRNLLNGIKSNTGRFVYKWSSGVDRKWAVYKTANFAPNNIYNSPDHNRYEFLCFYSEFKDVNILNVIMFDIFFSDEDNLFKKHIHYSRNVERDLKPDKPSFLIRRDVDLKANFLFSNDVKTNEIAEHRIQTLLHTFRHSIEFKYDANIQKSMYLVKCGFRYIKLMTSDYAAKLNTIFKNQNNIFDSKEGYLDFYIRRFFHENDDEKKSFLYNFLQYYEDYNLLNGYLNDEDLSEAFFINGFVNLYYEKEADWPVQGKDLTKLKNFVKQASSLLKIEKSDFKNVLVSSNINLKKKLKIFLPLNDAGIADLSKFNVPFRGIPKEDFIPIVADIPKPVEEPEPPKELEEPITSEPVVVIESPPVTSDISVISDIIDFPTPIYETESFQPTVSVGKYKNTFNAIRSYILKKSHDNIQSFKRHLLAEQAEIERQREEDILAAVQAELEAERYAKEAEAARQTAEEERKHKEAEEQALEEESEISSEEEEELGVTIQIPSPIIVETVEEESVPFKIKHLLKNVKKENFDIILQNLDQHILERNYDFSDEEMADVHEIKRIIEYEIAKRNSIKTKKEKILEEELEIIHQLKEDYDDYMEYLEFYIKIERRIDEIIRAKTPATSSQETVINVEPEPIHVEEDISSADIIIEETPTPSISIQIEEPEIITQITEVSHTPQKSVEKINQSLLKSKNIIFNYFKRTRNNIVLLSRGKKQVLINPGE